MRRHSWPPARSSRLDLNFPEILSAARRGALCQICERRASDKEATYRRMMKWRYACVEPLSLSKRLSHTGTSGCAEFRAKRGYLRRWRLYIRPASQAN